VNSPAPVNDLNLTRGKISKIEYDGLQLSSERARAGALKHPHFLGHPHSLRFWPSRTIPVNSFTETCGEGERQVCEPSAPSPCGRKIGGSVALVLDYMILSGEFEGYLMVNSSDAQIEPLPACGAY
jgi:hypothetical protein